MIAAEASVDHRGWEFSAAQLKTIQEVITLVMSCVFSVLYLKERQDQSYLDEGQHKDLQGKLLRFIQLVIAYVRSIGHIGKKKAAGFGANDD